MGRYIVAITGASGAVYARRLLRFLAERGEEIFLLVSDAGRIVLAEELGLEVRGEVQADRMRILRGLLGREEYGGLVYLDCRDLRAGIASGSWRVEGMVVVPCSMGALGRMAQGVSSNLIERAADVMLKERRPLVLAPRETPLSCIHLENMLRLCRAGAYIVPCMPGFYHRPEGIEDLVDFVVGRLLDALGIEHELFPRWGTES